MPLPLPFAENNLEPGYRAQSEMRLLLGHQTSPAVLQFPIQTPTAQRHAGAHATWCFVRA